MCDVNALSLYDTVPVCSARERSSDIECGFNCVEPFSERIQLKRRVVSEMFTVYGVHFA